MIIQKKRKRIMHFAIIVTISSILALSTSITVSAKEIEGKVTGSYYEFDKGSKYEISESSSNTKLSLGSKYGQFSIAGMLEEVAEVNGFTAYEVQEGNVLISYALRDEYVNSMTNEWYLVEDKSNTVDGMKLKEDILSGSIILQTSLTGDSWITDTIYTDIRGDDSEFIEDFYASKDIQQVNGCYYRIIVVYEVGKENITEKKILNWSGKEQEYKKCAEVYEFYLINSNENSEEAVNPEAKPIKIMGTRINTGRDNGYSGNEIIDGKDPHFNWNIGTFFINGYTRETFDTEGNIVFLKDVGDRVALWFKLEQDINCLNGKENLCISEDENGYDQHFEIEQTNFKHGALIISYTDSEGKKATSPIIYTDYLAANATTGANTKVELFEEGDYEVALNYEIKDSKGIDSYTNYRIFFKFSIRNANGMLYLFDSATGEELADNAITESGFRIDTAKSRYLNIDIVKSVLKKGERGYYTDERVNTAAKDGEIFNDEGIYIITVKNQYTNNAPTIKVLYVGNSPVLRAMALGYSLEEINILLSEGAELLDDGTLLMPIVQEESMVEDQVIETVASQVVEEASVTEKSEMSFQESNNTGEVVTMEETVNDVVNISPIIAIGAVGIVLIIAFIFMCKKRGTKKPRLSGSVSEEVDR